MEFETFFRRATASDQLAEGVEPYPFQRKLAEEPWPDALIVPTGFGKTAAVLGAWLWRVARKDPDTPRRLVYCLPMRTLVEQTAAVACRWVAAAEPLFRDEVIVDVLMGGLAKTKRRGLPDWMLNPERPAILIGTQDLLVSAALMRGYGASRYRWPVDFALLHNGACWVFDEVQLMGASLPTSAQLEAFRRKYKDGNSNRTLWMSATLDAAWLKTVDLQDPLRARGLSEGDIGRAPHLWRAVKQLLKLELPAAIGSKDAPKTHARALALAARTRVRPGTVILMFLNTVARAQAVFEALAKEGTGPDLILVHSRFRHPDRARKVERLREPTPQAGRIVVATQALEAGVDTSSAVMITEIAPWSSLVQRFGRCNRYGECGTAGAEVLWIDLPDEAAAPYDPIELVGARETLTNISACGPADLERIKPSAPPRPHVIRWRDVVDLFDTEPDLSGLDVDVSLYVRETEDTDVRLFWRPVEGEIALEDAHSPAREELCPAPIGSAKALVKRAQGRVWRWDGLATEWRAVSEREIVPGMILWVAAEVGGYDPEIGFDPALKLPVAPLGGPDTPLEAVDADPDTQSSKVRISLARHSAHVRDEALRLAAAFKLGDDERDLIVEAALWHDLGKAHPAFVARMGGRQPPLAKSPDFNPKPAGEIAQQRPYFRHELASALGYLANHGWSEEASLTAYLIAAHHGKVRLRLRALPREPPADGGRLFARGVWDGDLLPNTRLGEIEIPKTALDLDLMLLGDGRCGPSWSARTQHLLHRLGPFQLAWLEALVRIADWRASQMEEEAGHDDL